jgi:multiple antibiotic resistance protein
MLITTFLQPIFGLFGAMDPVGNTPVFLALTSDQTPSRRRAIALRAVIRAGFILVLFTVAGSGILDVFAISLGSFRIAGGLVLALLGLQIMFDISFSGAPTEIKAEGLDISMVPLATPLIAGPGTISMAIILVKEYGYLLTLLGIFVNLVLTLLAFWSAGWLHKTLGRQGAEAFAKIMGLIVMAVGVELVRKGLVG